VIEFTYATKDFSDLIQVPSTFQFDESEKDIVTEEDSRY